MYVRNNRTVFLSLVRSSGGLLALLTALVLGCSGDNTDGGTGPGGESKKITVQDVILNPRSPAPGDTMQATAVVTSSSANIGDFVRYKWTATGGDFLEDDQGNVRWVAPDTSSIFTISVTAENSVSSSALSRTLFTTRYKSVIPLDAGEIHLGQGDEIIYLGSPRRPTEPGFDGFAIRRLTPTLDEQIAPFRGFQTALSQDLTTAAQLLAIPQLTVLVIDLQTGLWEPIPNDPYLQRITASTRPAVSNNGRLIAYEGFSPDQEMLPSQGGVDTFLVYTYDVMTKKRSRVANRGENFLPRFSSDGNWLVFVSNRIGSTDWEYYALPVINDSVPTDTLAGPGELRQLTDTGGTVGPDTPGPFAVPIRWSPNEADPAFATTDRNGRLTIVPVDGSGAIGIDVPGEVRDFAWAPSGNDLVSTNGTVLYRVGRTGGAEAIHQAASGDNLSLVSWSYVNDLILYMVTRSANSWYEVLDLSGTSGLTGPVSVSPSGSRGDASVYASLIEVRPVWIPGENSCISLFFDSVTPSASSVGFSGLSQ